LLLLQSSERRGWAAFLLSEHAAAAPYVQFAALPLQLLLRLHPALAAGAPALVRLLVSRPNQLQLLLLQSSERRGWAACHLFAHAAAAPSVQSAALPLRLLLRLHPALAVVMLPPILQGPRHQQTDHHLAALPLPAKCQCTACGEQVAQRGLLRSAACVPPAPHQPPLLLLLLLQET
jgi:hypothetical protein